MAGRHPRERVFDLIVAQVVDIPGGVQRSSFDEESCHAQSNASAFAAEAEHGRLGAFPEPEESHGIGDQPT